MSATTCVVGIAVANAPLERARRPTGARWAVAHADAGRAAWVARLLALLPTVLGLDATGGDPPAVVAALAAARRPVAGGKPRHARDVAQAPGQLATPAALDARAWASFAEAGRPPPRPLPAAPAAARRALLAQRRPRVTRRTADQTRRGRAPARRQTALQAHLTWRQARLARLDDARATPRRASPGWREREALWRRVPGRGPVWTRTLRLDRPALGPLSRPRLAALVGVAPWHRARGPRRGRRTIGGGRAHVRATLSMRTLVAGRDPAVLNVFYARWRAAGKTAKVARAACRRQRLTILKARVNHHTPWPPQEVRGA